MIIYILVLYIGLVVKYMKNYKYLLFDVDGTIIESGPGVENSYQYALDTLGYNVKVNRKTIVNRMKPDSKKNWCGEINLNGECIKLHWEYIK